MTTLRRLAQPAVGDDAADERAEERAGAVHAEDDRGLRLRQAEPLGHVEDQQSLQAEVGELRPGLRQEQDGEAGRVAEQAAASRLRLRLQLADVASQYAKSKL